MSAHVTRTEAMLRTFGAPLLLVDGAAAALRRKDFALLVYLCVDPRLHQRSTLAGLLWAESSPADARHSLTQALGRLRKLLGMQSIEATRDTVRWTGDLACDALMLAGAAAGAPSLLEFYGGEFLEGIAFGGEGREFERWAEARRAEYRDTAADLLDEWGEAAERREEWAAALRFGQRTTEVDPFRESGHRRVMRALNALGDRNRALLYY